jgi:hypothetical protein
MSTHKQKKDLSNKEKTYEEAFVDINLYLLKDYKRGYFATYTILMIMIL